MSTQVKKVSKPATHPPFKVMVSVAVKSLQEKKGCSRQAIRKYINANYKVTESAMTANLNKTLRKLMDANTLMHPKASTGLFKLNKTEQNKEKKIAKAKAAAVKKSVAKPKKKAVAKKVKSAPKKAVSKKPKTKKVVKKTVVKKSAKKTPKKVAKKPVAKKSPKKKTVKKAKK